MPSVSPPTTDARSPGAPFLEIGRVGRAHGLHGEVVVDLTSNVLARLAPGAQLWADGRPHVVDAAHPHQRHWLVKFAGVEDRTAAEALRGAVLTAPPAADPDEPDALFVHELVGAQVRTAAGESRGTVVAVQDNPAADLLVLDSGDLVPLTFVDRAGDGIIHLAADVPEGLFDED
jgi:16S rRNA processing protein RimM